MILDRFYSCVGDARHVPVLFQPGRREAAAKGQFINCRAIGGIFNRLAGIASW
jgi:hypothetical protein